MIRVYPIKAVPAPRQCARDAYDPSPRVQRYHAFRDEVRLRSVQLPRPFHHVLFVIQMPRSWSAAKLRAHEGMPHETTPDRDNLEKALLDSVYGSDAHVWDGRTTKVWGCQDLIVVSREQIHIEPPLNLSSYYQAAAGQRDVIPARELA